MSNDQPPIIQTNTESKPQRRKAGKKRNQNQQAIYIGLGVGGSLLLIGLFVFLASNASQDDSGPVAKKSRRNSKSVERKKVDTRMPQDDRFDIPQDNRPDMPQDDRFDRPQDDRFDMPQVRERPNAPATQPTMERKESSQMPHSKQQQQQVNQLVEQIKKENELKRQEDIRHSRMVEKRQEQQKREYEAK